MLIIPVSGKFGIDKTPLVTLTLVVFNCLIFFMFQIDDDQFRNKAEQYYWSSGLADIEMPSYIQFLEAAGTPVDENLGIVEEMDAQALMAIRLEMASDAIFLKRLSNGQVIAFDDPQYEQWRSLRKTYEKKRNKSVAFAYGLRPAFPRFSVFFTYMFLHGGVDHLLGNMVFLWILGCMLEVGSGRVLFTATYLLSGLFSAGLFYLIYPSSTSPLVGASGAVAGLMGAYTVLYGLKKVHVFYSLGFYFNTAKVPAALLLPIWLINEFYQLFLSGPSHVAYAAHIGGLISGAALAFYGIRFSDINREKFHVPAEDKISPLMNDAVEHLGNLEIDRAQTIFEQILEQSPQNREALTHLFHIHKLNPDSRFFHETAGKLLRVLMLDKVSHQDALTVYETYGKLTRRPKLPTQVYLQLSGIMIGLGQLDRAEKIVTAILNAKPQTEGLPTSLIKLSRAFRKNNRMEQWERCRKLVNENYPDSVEAEMVSLQNDTSS